MTKKVIKTVKTEDARIMLVRHADGRYTVETYDYETATTYGKNNFYIGFENAMKHFNKAI